MGIPSVAASPGWGTHTSWDGTVMKRRLLAVTTVAVVAVAGALAALFWFAPWSTKPNHPTANTRTTHPQTPTSPRANASTTNGPTANPPRANPPTPTDLQWRT